MDSHCWAGGEEGMVEHGQASPKVAPETCVLQVVQTGARPSIRRVHNVVTGTTGTEFICVAG